MTPPTILGHEPETIVAQATALGRAGLAIVRVSGPRAYAICRPVADHWPPSPRIATLSAIRDSAAGILDRALVTRFEAPASFTGEDVVEIATHGGLIIPATVMAALIERGARLALPGEFTRRAFLNGKLDLIQAEATGDLIEATSRAAHRVAMDQLDGGLSRRVLGIRNDLVALEALLAYDIDFPEEDDGPIPRERIGRALDDARSALEGLNATARAGELVRDGALIVLAGAPNAGKSSLFNALIGQRRAIVTEIAGTTRDAIEAVVDAGRWPLRLVDTAGLRATTERVEQLGVEVAEDYIERAAIVLVCGDAIESLRKSAAAVVRLRAGPVILVATKSDLGEMRDSGVAEIRHDIHDAPDVAAAISVSAETGAGLATLTERILHVLDAAAGASNMDAPILTRARHQHIIAQAHDELLAFGRAWQGQTVPVSIAAVHIRAAVSTLEDLIGRVDVEQILDEVFSRFCVGK